MTEQISIPLPDARAVSGRSAAIGDPDDILRNPRLSSAEKRAILADWASDAHSVKDHPALRQLDDGSVVDVDEILRALQALDAGADQAEITRGPFEGSAGKFLSRWRSAFRPRRDDDDDPPPCPASAALPMRLRLVSARSDGNCIQFA